ncbi:MAG: dicarboxylate/amino acid:cation symporter, partial [Sandaracinaceae bacterium]
SLGDVRKLGRLGGKTIGVYLGTTAIAVSIGLVLANLIKPGEFVGAAARAQLQSQFAGAADSSAANAAEAPSTVDNILSIIPDNPIGSLASGDMLQVIFFAMIFGVAITLLGNKERGQPIVTFFDRVQEAMVMIIHLVMMIAPFGVAALVADVVGQSGISVLGALLVYSLTVLLGLALHTAIVYGGLVKAFSGLRIPDFLRAIRPAQLLAFSTSSSSATLPVSMECAEESLGISNPVASFVLPLGSTVNMDGTALYQGVAAVFIAQVFDVDLSFTDQLAIVATATMASVGAAGVPGAGIVTLAMVLTTVGIPPVGVALILGMDRLLDMFRTTVNVTGDLTVAAVMAASEGETLRVLTPAEDKSDPDHGFEARLDKGEQPIEPADKKPPRGAEEE